MARPTIPLVAVLAFGGCTADPENDASGFGSLSTTGVSGGPNGTNPKFDVGGGGASGGATAGDGQGDSSCPKMDFLFVVDNSGSMLDEQENLVNAFPGLIMSIQQVTGAADFHVMAIPTDDEWAGTLSCGSAGCCVNACGAAPDTFACSEVGADPVACDGANGSSCADSLGIGRVVDQTGQACGLDGQANYMLSDQDMLAATFACLGQVGTTGSSNEQPMEAMLEALSPENNAPGACNAGFVRDDALLVVVVVTDEEDDYESKFDLCGTEQSGSVGEPEDWAAGLKAIKFGKEEEIVVLTLAGPPAGDPNHCGELDKCSSWINGAEEAPRLAEFTSQFTFGMLGPVCVDDYKSFFNAAVGVIEGACAIYDPQG